MAAKQEKPQTPPPVEKGPPPVTDVQPVEPVLYNPEKELYKWVAPSRPFKKRTREFWITIVATASLLAFILFLAEGVTPVLLIIALLFLYYVLSTVKPEEIEYTLTSRGVKIAEKLTPWTSMRRYWITKRLGSDLLVLETYYFPGRMELVVPEKDISKISDVLQRYLPEEKPEETSVDKVTNWISAKLPQN